MLCKFAILLREQLLTIFPGGIAERCVTYYIIFIVNTLVDNDSRPMSARESLQLFVKTKVECSACHVRRDMQLTLEKESVFVLPVNLPWASLDRRMIFKAVTHF